MRKIGDHAVVLGAGMAGPPRRPGAGRRVRAGHGRGTRPAPEAAEHRRGVPQGRHAHLLLPRGTQILDELFPGLLDDLVAGGAAGGAGPRRDLASPRGGHRLRLQGRHARTLHLPGQPALPGSITCAPGSGRCPRSRSSTSARSSAWSPPPARDRVTGVRILRRAGGTAEETLDADLVLDATGRSGRTAAWLADDRLRRSRRRSSSRSTSSTPPGTCGCARAPWAATKFVAIGAEPGRPTGLVMFAQEEDRWVLTLIGYDGHHPPTDPDGLPRLRRDRRPTRRLRRDPRRRAPRRHRRPPVPGQPAPPLRPAAPLPGRAAGLRRRDLQHEPGVRPGHVGGRAAGGGTAGLAGRRRR